MTVVWKTCEEVLDSIETLLIRCNNPAVMLVQHRGRNEGPYQMCLACGEHNSRNRNAEVLARKETV